jgi:hypothetical protein
MHGSKANRATDSSVFSVNETRARAGGERWKSYSAFRFPPTAPENIFRIDMMFFLHQKTSIGYLEKALSGETKMDPVSFA